jgi:hypothetical protein
MLSWLLFIFKMTRNCNMSYQLPYKLNIFFRHEDGYNPSLLISEVVFGIAPLPPPSLPPIGSQRPQVKKLLENATQNTISEPINTPRIRQFKGGALPLQITGITDATVYFEGTLVNNVSEVPTAIWSPISNASYTTDTCDAIFVMYPYIRAIVADYVSGNITVKIEI